jgi:hypothetical protein
MITEFVAIVAVALVMVGGLAWDGGQQIKTLMEASNLAESAARAGAQANPPGGLLVGDTAIDPAAAQTRVNEFLAAAGHPGAGSVGVAGNEVTVTVTLTRGFDVLPLPARQISATASATPIRGVEAGGD